MSKRTEREVDTAKFERLLDEFQHSVRTYQCAVDSHEEGKPSACEVTERLMRQFRAAVVAEVHRLLSEFRP